MRMRGRRWKGRGPTRCFCCEAGWLTRADEKREAEQETAEEFYERVVVAPRKQAS